METQEEVITKRSDRWWKLVSYIFTRQLRKSFHKVYVLNTPPIEATQGKQIVCFMNHPSWNDPMLMVYAHNLYFSDYHAYAPIDAEALEGYKFMKKIGLYGVTHGNAGAMRRFLRTSKAVLENSRKSILWITPQGRFTDQRERPASFQPGLGAVLSRNFHPEKVTVIPAAFEYTFGEEKKPEIMINFGPPLTPPDKNDSTSWTKACEDALGETQDQLARSVISRFDSDTDFSVILVGSTGVGGVYGLWQRLLATLKGEAYDPSHGSLTSDSKQSNSTKH